MASLIALGLGIGYLKNSENDFEKYNEFIKNEQINTNYSVNQVNSLENVLIDLNEAEKALTKYSSGVYLTMRSHSPDVDESLEELNSARSNILQGNCYDQDNVKTLDRKISFTQSNLNKLKRNQGMESYEDERTQIQYLAEDTKTELARLEEEIPLDILKKKESLKTHAKSKENLGCLLIFLGGLGCITSLIRVGIDASLDGIKNVEF